MQLTDLLFSFKGRIPRLHWWIATIAVGAVAGAATSILEIAAKSAGYLVISPDTQQIEPTGTLRHRRARHRRGKCVDQLRAQRQTAARSGPHWLVAGRASSDPGLGCDRARGGDCRAARAGIDWISRLVHVIDRHQLTKDPSMVMGEEKTTASSPARPMTPFELGRYLDYCSEMLSLTGKVAALYAQTFPDPVVVEAANDIEMLATGLSGKIWQKITILQGAIEGAEGAAGKR
jgi:hypothetical protein